MGLRWLTAALGVAAVVALFVVLRPGDDAGTPSPATPATPPPSDPSPLPTGTDTTPPPPPGPPPPPPGAPPATLVQVAVRGGGPVGGIRRVTVTKDRRVVVVVRSDVADNVHLHGYDIARDVGPGRPARIAFRATLAGRYEMELEESGLPIVDLRVNP